MTERAHLRLATGFYVFFLLACALPLGVLATVREAHNPGGSFLAWLVAFYSAARLGVLSARGDLRLLSLTFYLFVYIWLGITPLAQLLHDRFPWRGHYLPGTVLFAYIIIAVGIAAYELGARWKAGERALLARLDAFLRSRRFEVSRGLLLALASVVLSGLVIYLLGGVPSVLVSRADMFQTIKELSGSDYEAGGQLIFTLLRVPPYVAMYCLWWHWRRRTTGSRGSTALVLLLATLVVNVIVSSPLNAPRYWFGTILLSMFFAALPWGRSLSFGLCAVAIGVGLLVVFPYADLFRSSTDVSKVYERDYDPITEKGDYDCFQQLANSVDYVRENGLAYGRQAAGTLLFWVPRRFWAGKPIQSGVLVAEWVGYEYTNLSMALWGEAFMDGGLLFVAVVLFLYGYATAVVERLFLERQQDRDSLAAMLVPMVAAYQIFLLRGSLMSTFAYFVPILLLLFLTGRRQGNAPVPAIGNGEREVVIPPAGRPDGARERRGALGRR